MAGGLTATLSGTGTHSLRLDALAPPAGLALRGSQPSLLPMRRTVQEAGERGGEGLSGASERSNLGKA
jgi:hypothetical protein